VTDYTLTWYNHIDHLISRLNPVCYAERAVKAMLSRKALRMPHFSYVHSIISYGIIFWGNTPNSIKIFRMQNKKRERERERERETNSKKMDSCQGLFKTTEISHFCYQYIFSLLWYMVNNKHLFTKNLEVHNYLLRIFIYPLLN